ncbi:MAG TPA: hypothetical protein PLV83_04685, partial [Bacilli bacterium]|nr:hypothetical protein [Bacilli bacterium]
MKFVLSLKDYSDEQFSFTYLDDNLYELDMNINNYSTDIMTYLNDKEAYIDNKRLNLHSLLLLGKKEEFDIYQKFYEELE